MDYCEAVICDCELYHPNAPLFPEKDCRWGMNCINANCYYNHPEGWNPPRVRQICPNGAICRYRTCNLLHPAKKKARFISKPCQYGSNCDDKSCGRIHDNPPKKCRWGNTCHRENCKFDHEESDELCPYGHKCNRINRCLYSHHFERQTSERIDNPLLPLEEGFIPPIEENKEQEKKRRPVTYASKYITPIKQRQKKCPGAPRKLKVEIPERIATFRRPNGPTPNTMMGELSILSPCGSEENDRGYDSDSSCSLEEPVHANCTILSMIKNKSTNKTKSF
jgi:hypothetical protein